MNVDTVLSTTQLPSLSDWVTTSSSIQTFFNVPYRHSLSFGHHQKLRSIGEVPNVHWLCSAPSSALLLRLYLSVSHSVLPSLMDHTLEGNYFTGVTEKLQRCELKTTMVNKWVNALSWRNDPPGQSEWQSETADLKSILMIVQLCLIKQCITV